MLQADFSTWRGHTVGMCRTLTALGVLYHNYRIINTPPPSQEGLYRMHEAECRADGLVGGRQSWVGGHSAPAGSTWVGSANNHDSSALDTLMETGCITSILTILLLLTVVPSPAHGCRNSKANIDTERQKQSKHWQTILSVNLMLWMEGWFISKWNPG